MTATRRELLAGTALGSLAVVVPNAAARTAPNRARQEVVLRGRAIAVAPSGRRVVVAHDRRRTIAIHGRGRPHLIDVGGQPLDVAISPDGRLAAVTTASWDEPGLALVDLRTRKLLKRVAVGPAPSCVTFTPGGERLVVTGGEQSGTSHVLDARTLKILGSRHIGTVPRGVAASGNAAWVALNGDHHVARIDLPTGRVRKRLRVPWSPHRVALSPDGHKLLVSHADRVSVVDLRTGAVASHDAGRQPSGVAWSRHGRALVALGGAGRIVALGHGRSTRVGGAPRGLAVAGGRAWTVDALTGAIDVVKA